MMDDEIGITYCKIVVGKKIMAANLGGDIDRWIEITNKCQYLPENDLKVRRQISRRLRGAESYTSGAVHAYPTDSVF